jgi:hypothetical protein
LWEASSTCWRTPIWPKMLVRWKLRDRPRMRRCVAPSALTSAPPSFTEPRVSRTRPVMASMTVDLPAPFGPISPRIWPRCSVSETPSTAFTPP